MAYALVNETKQNKTVIKVGDICFGGREVVIMAGPCAVESREQIYTVAESLAKLSVPVIRGGAYKPRTSPYAFQGLGEEGVLLLAEAAKSFGLLSVTEVIDEQSLCVIEPKIDILQIGTRNMQNYSLLKAVARTGKPILLKRGMAATVEEWLLAAEYILAEGNDQVILCERGIRTFDNSLRNTLDLASVALVKEKTGLPVIVDPSHATGKKELIAPMARGAVAVGADGLIIEIHSNPCEAVCDGHQSLDLDQFNQVVNQVKLVAASVNKTLGGLNNG